MTCMNAGFVGRNRQKQNGIGSGRFSFRDIAASAEPPAPDAATYWIRRSLGAGRRVSKRLFFAPHVRRKRKGEQAGKAVECEY